VQELTTATSVKEEAGRGWNSRSESSAEGAKLKTLSSRATRCRFLCVYFPYGSLFCWALRMFSAAFSLSSSQFYFSLSHFFGSGAASHKIARQAAPCALLLAI
jgi:hypothetical protein